MAAFQPAGDRARWRVVYDLLVATKTNGVVTYEALATALGLDAEQDRHAIQMAVRRAAREHEEHDKRALDVVPNQGYRIVPAPEQLGLARRHQQKAGRSLARGHSKTVNVDLSGLDTQTRHAFEVVAQAFALQMDFNRRLSVRQNKLDEAVREITNRTERSEEEIANLRARLERLEKPE